MLQKSLQRSFARLVFGTALAGSAVGAAMAAPTSVNALGDIEPRIVGGSEVTTNDRPWMAAILSSGTNDAFNAQFCGGSVIAPTWILTAAHCLDGERASRVDVMVGRLDLRGTGGERVRAKRIVMHPNYNSATNLNDVALIELTESVSVTPVTLATPGNSSEAPGRLAEVQGWGNLRESGGFSSKLMAVRVPVVAQAVCDRQYGGIDEDAMICAGFSDGGRDSCQGDSGGPLFVPGNNGFDQIGVVSFGIGCARPNFAGVYARVSNYFDWINTTAGIGGGEPPPPPSGDTLEAKFTMRCNTRRVCRFNASSTETDSRITSYIWDTGDGGEGTGRVLRHRYAADGTYPVSLFVTNADGELDEVTQNVTIGDTDPEEPGEGGVLDFAGTLAEKERVRLPGSGDEVLRVAAGNMKVDLTVPSNSVFIVRLQRYDAQANRWQEVARVRSANGTASIDRNVEAGRYQVRLIARKVGGDYAMRVTHR